MRTIWMSARAAANAMRSKLRRRKRQDAAQVAQGRQAPEAEAPQQHNQQQQQRYPQPYVKQRHRKGYSVLE